MPVVLITESLLWAHGFACAAFLGSFMNLPEVVRHSRLCALKAFLHVVGMIGCLVYPFDHESHSKR